jgi:hypothetical protein
MLHRHIQGSMRCLYKYTQTARSVAFVLASPLPRTAETAQPPWAFVAARFSAKHSLLNFHLASKDKCCTRTPAAQSLGANLTMMSYHETHQISYSVGIRRSEIAKIRSSMLTSPTAVSESAQPLSRPDRRQISPKYL